MFVQKISSKTYDNTWFFAWASKLLKNLWRGEYAFITVNAELNWSSEADKLSNIFGYSIDIVIALARMHIKIKFERIGLMERS